VNADKAKLIKTVKGVPMFSALDEVAIRNLLGSCQELSFRKGAQIFLPIQKAEKFFVVTSGRVKIFKLSPKGDEQILHLYGPGETFGEAAMWMGINYPAHAEAVTDVTLLAIGRESLKKAITDNAELAMGMLAGLSTKLREFNRLVEQLSLKEVPARLAQVLLSVSGQESSRTFRLPQTKRQLAAQIGTVPETLSRALGKLRNDGLIGMRGSKITILNPEALENLAGNG
jgi:CRP-like cAMP-binding protein